MGKYLAEAMTAGRQLRNNVHTSKRRMNLHKTSISTGPSLVPVWVYRNTVVGSHRVLYYFSKTNLLLARIYQLQTVSQITGDRHLVNCKKSAFVRPLPCYKQRLTRL